MNHPVAWAGKLKQKDNRPHLTLKKKALVPPITVSVGSPCPLPPDACLRRRPRPCGPWRGPLCASAPPRRTCPAAGAAPSPSRAVAPFHGGRGMTVCGLISPSLVCWNQMHRCVGSQRNRDYGEFTPPSPSVRGLALQKSRQMQPNGDQTPRLAMTRGGRGGLGLPGALQLVLFVGQEVLERGRLQPP